VTEQPRHAIPGWYGKMPSLGDFASRRVPDEFVRPWDAWLQRMLEGTRQLVGESWLERYLVMPMWRFVLLPGLLEPSGWTGLLMPSVDRVGRHFPMTLAVPLPSLHEVAEVLFRREDWYAHLEAVALSALDPTRGPEEFDEAVAGCVLTTACCEDAEGRWDTERRLGTVDCFARIAATEALAAWAREACWSSLWWTGGGLNDHPRALQAAALPIEEQFARLLAEPRDGMRDGPRQDPLASPEGAG
jgi:type VI secretion system protein ImpM